MTRDTGPGAIAWTVAAESSSAAVVEAQLLQALEKQSGSVSERFDLFPALRRRAFMVVLRWTAVALACLGLGLVAWVETSSARVKPHPFYGPAFAVLGLIFLFLPRVEAALRALTRRSLVRSARRTVAALEPRLPGVVHYVVDSGTVTARWGGASAVPTWTKACAEVGSAYHGSSALVAFARSFAIRPLFVVLLPEDAATRAKVIHELRASDLEPLTKLKS